MASKELFMATQRELRMIAAASGLKTYDPGQPCKYGHFTPRYVSTGGCLGCLNTKVTTGSGVTRTLAALQLQPVLVAHDLLPQLRDILEDAVSDAVERWHADMGMATPERIAGWRALRVATQGKRGLRDAAIVPVPVAPVMSEKRRNAERFLEALAGMAGAQLDRATELTRQTGEPDGAFRTRIKAKTLEHLGTG